MRADNRTRSDAMKLRIAVQSKGRLNEDTMGLLAEAGIKVSSSKRTLLVSARKFPMEVLYLRDDAYVSPSMSAVQASVLPKFVEQMKNSSRISEEFMAAITKYTETLVEQFTPKTGYDLNQIPYLLDSDLLTTSQKRDILDEVAEDDLLDLRAVPGLAAFDGIEASSLFRNQMTRKIESAGRDNMDIWAIYAYFRLME